MFLRSPNSIVTIAAAAISICGINIGKGQTHSADAIVGNDPPGLAFYTGTSNPAGPDLINLIGGSPGYLNSVSGGAANTAQGDLSVGPFPLGSVEVLAVAITVADTAGASHSLSSMNDPALADIVTDLNTTNGGGEAQVVSYAYGSAPPEFGALEAALSAGEAANSGRPFDLLLAATPFFPTLPDPPWWGIGFSNEVGNLDGITALNVTDIGAIAAPEPGALVTCGLGIGALILIPRRKRAM